MKKVVIGVIIITYIIVGVGIYSWQRGVSNKVEKSNIEHINKLEDQVETLMSNMGSNTKVNISTESASSETPAVVNETFAIYGMDKNAQEKEINFYVAIDKNLDIPGKIKLLTDKLSRFKFGFLPIEFVKINEENGKKIAVINLKESEANLKIVEAEALKGSNWRAGYFQGSAGGTETSYSLIETILQRKYTGAWIQGVQFLYDGKPIDKWEHVEELSKVNYRE